MDDMVQIKMHNENRMHHQWFNVHSMIWPPNVMWNIIVAVFRTQVHEFMAQKLCRRQSTVYLNTAAIIFDMILVGDIIECILIHWWCIQLSLNVLIWTMSSTLCIIGYIHDNMWMSPQYHTPVKLFLSITKYH